MGYQERRRSRQPAVSVGYFSAPDSELGTQERGVALAGIHQRRFDFVKELLIAVKSVANQPGRRESFDRISLIEHCDQRLFVELVHTPAMGISPY